jgi:hypothetical protein
VVKDPYAVHREMQAIVRMAAEPRPVADSLKAALRRSSAALGISYRRAMSFWYGHTERVRVTPDEAERLRAEADRLRLLRIERLEREIAELRAEVRLRNARRRAAGAGEDRGVDQAVAETPLNCAAS